MECKEGRSTETDYIRLDYRLVQKSYDRMGKKEARRRGKEKEGRKVKKS